MHALTIIEILENDRFNTPLDKYTCFKDFKLAMEIMKRDGFTCRFCGLEIKENNIPPGPENILEIHHKDHDHGNNEKDNLATICCFCHLVFHLDQARVQNKVDLILLPWMTQIDLNLLCLFIGVVLADNKKDTKEAVSLYGLLKKQHNEFKQEFGMSLSDPAMFFQCLKRHAQRFPKQYSKQQNLLKNIRVLPRLTAFKNQLHFCSKYTDFSYENIPGER